MSYKPKQKNIEKLEMFLNKNKKLFLKKEKENGKRNIQ